VPGHLGTRIGLFMTSRSLEMSASALLTLFAMLGEESYSALGAALMVVAGTMFALFGTIGFYSLRHCCVISPSNAFKPRCILLTIRTVAMK